MKSGRYRYVLDPDDDDSPIVYDGPGVVVCEGRSDANFLSALFDHHGIDGFEVTFPTGEQGGGEGALSIGKCLKGIMAGSGARAIKTVVIVRDCDDSPDKSFRQARSDLEFAQLDVPDQPTRFTLGDPRVAILMIPGAGTKGTLETLLLQAIKDANPAFMDCVDKFASCLDDPHSWSENKRAKMKLQALIAGCCKQDPASSLSWVWGKSGNPVPIDSSHFDEIAEFFKSAHPAGS